jgi:hypothetical protein
MGDFVGGAHAVEAKGGLQVLQVRKKFICVRLGLKSTLRRKLLVHFVSKVDKPGCAVWKLLVKQTSSGFCVIMAIPPSQSVAKKITAKKEGT